MKKIHRKRHLRLVRAVDRDRLRADLRVSDCPERFRRVLFPNDWSFHRADLEALQEATKRRLDSLTFFFSIRIGTRLQFREYTQLKRQRETLHQLISCFDSLSDGKRTIRYWDDLEPLIENDRRRLN
jgi:hypothetical protein